MTRLALLADLHFGSIPPGFEDRLLDDLLQQSPDAVLIAGDLTMRATKQEYADARRWLDRLPLKRLIVPGNHDIVRFNLIERFFYPFDRFENAVDQDERDPLSLKLCHVVGLNTVASWQPHLKWQEGRVRRETIKTFSKRISRTPANKFRIVVAHHPFAEVPGMERAHPVRRAMTTLDAFHASDVDLVLSGHTHRSYVLPIASETNHLVAIGAPTAMSSRKRGEENGYWLIDLSAEHIALTLRLVKDGRFTSDPPRLFMTRDFAITPSGAYTD